MITVQKLALAIQKRFGGTEAEALAESRTVMSYFGFRSVIIDNAIHPDDRKVFYALHDAGLLQSFWETVPLLDGRNWRIFYWSLNETDLDRILVDKQAPPEEPVYQSLPDEAWGRPAPPAPRRAARTRTAFLLESRGCRRPPGLQRSGPARSAGRSGRRFVHETRAGAAMDPESPGRLRSPRCSRTEPARDSRGCHLRRRRPRLRSRPGRGSNAPILQGGGCVRSTPRSAARRCARRGPHGTRIQSRFRVRGRRAQAGLPRA